MIEPFREFGDEKLSAEERESIAQRHAEHFFGLAEMASQKLMGVEQNTWLDRFEIEHDNLRAALDYYGNKDSGASQELELAIFLSRFWDIRGYRSEGRERLQRALARQQPGASSLKAKGLIWLGLLSYRQDDYEPAKQSLSESAKMSREIDDQESLASSLNRLGFVARAQGHYQEAKLLFTDSLKLSQEVNSVGLIGLAFHGLALVAEAEGDDASAKDCFLKSLSCAEEIQDLRWIAAAQDNLGVIAREQGDYSEARQHHEKSLALMQGAGNKGGIADCYFNLGLLEEIMKEHQAASGFFQKSLALFIEIGNRHYIARALEGIARMAEAISRGEDAARIFGAADALRINIAAPLSPAEQKNYGHLMSSVKERFPSAWQEASERSLDEAITYALSLGAASTD